MNEWRKVSGSSASAAAEMPAGRRAGGVALGGTDLQGIPLALCARCVQRFLPCARRGSDPPHGEGWISPTGPIFKEDNDILVHRCLKVDSPWIVHLKFWSKAPVLRQYLMTSCRSLNSNSCILDKG